MKVRMGDGDWYEFEGDRLLVKEARELETATGMGLKDFSDGIRRGKVDALVFMLYLAQRRAGVAVRFRDFDDANIADLQIDDESTGGADTAAVSEPDVSPLAARMGGELITDPPPPTPIHATGKPRKSRKAATG